MTIGTLLQHPDRFLYRRPVGKANEQCDHRGLHCATEQLFVRVAEAQEADIEHAVAAARMAFDEGAWPQLSPQEPAAYLRALATEFDIRVVDTARILTSETGVVFAMAKMIACMVGAAYAEYADYADRFSFVEKRQTGPYGAPAGLLVHEPVGVVAAIVPVERASLRDRQ